MVINWVISCWALVESRFSITCTFFGVVGACGQKATCACNMASTELVMGLGGRCVSSYRHERWLRRLLQSCPRLHKLLGPKQRFGAVSGGALQVDCSIGRAVWRPGDFGGSLIITRSDAAYQAARVVSDTLESEPQAPTDVDVVLLQVTDGQKEIWGLIK